MSIKIELKFVGEAKLNRIQKSSTYYNELRIAFLGDFGKKVGYYEIYFSKR